MNEDEPQDIATGLSRPVGFSIWMVAATFLCAILACAVAIVLTLHCPVLKEHGGWQLAVFAAVALVSGVVVFPAARKLEAREAARLQAQGKAPESAGAPTSSLVLGVLLFGGTGVFVLWPLLQGRMPDDPSALGAGIVSLVIGLACARMAWARMRGR